MLKMRCTDLGTLETAAKEKEFDGIENFVNYLKNLINKRSN
jgi:hypothetical protein